MAMDDARYGEDRVDGAGGTVFKRRQTKTHGGRRVTGEKGIGRFACCVAHRLELDSVSAETKERVRAWFNWGDFEAEDRYLDQVRCVGGDRGRLLAGGSTGTVPHLAGLGRTGVSRSFEICVSPRPTPAPLPGRPRTSGFKLIVEDEGLSRLSGPIAPPRFLENPRYRLTGRMEADRAITAAIHT